ncbi:LysR family transcriptional regulator [Ottowia sp.]|uniref:LysR family transcriptional regulator n=1 Tax=Ottowia sp. TaxID=1898956 RepID=UPI002C82662F|nr:LysR family transcriptional regulator [Ottowia sp.]
MSAPARPLDRPIDLTSLQLFVAVAETGAIAQAAQRERIAASAVSKRVAELESTLGAALLYRQARGVTLTPAGQSLLHHARSVLFGLDQLHGDLREYASGVRGHVRMHASMSAIVQFLPEDLGRFIHSHPQVKIDLEEHLSSAVERAVMEGAADLGICHAGSAQGGLQLRPYRQDRLALIAPPALVPNAPPAIDFADTLDFDHVGLNAGSSIALAMHQAAALAGRSVRLRIRVTGLDAMCRMIANGLGVGVMPQRAFELIHGASPLRCIPLQDAWARRQISLVARDFDSLPVTARALVEHLTGDAAAA